MSSGQGVNRGGRRRRARRRRFARLLVERGVALVLLVLALPLVLLACLHVLLVDGWPVLHRGQRLGRGKQPFAMWKVRTLRVGAERTTGAGLLNHGHDVHIPGGRFLRDTRLDELPQLWNIVRGDMGFVGPRPERPEVYAAMCRDIPGYERRFHARPGLIGVSQLYTPHGTPKRYRTLIDNGGLRAEISAAREVQIVLFTIWAVLVKVLRRVSRACVVLWKRLGGSQLEKRRLRRVATPGAVAHLGNGHARVAQLLDMNEETILLAADYEPGLEQEAEITLEVPVGGRSRASRRTARCSVSLVQRRSQASRGRVVLRYRALSPRSEYMIHQYFLRNSLAAPRPTWDGPPAALPAAARVAGGARPLGGSP